MKRVLVVDDDSNLAELVADFCQQAGFEVKVVTDPLKVQEIASSWLPNLITLDLEMPGMDGVEVLQTLQSRPETRRIPVVIVSVLAKGALADGLLKGASLVFEKPLRLQKLVQRMREVLDEPVAAGDRPSLESFPKNPLH